jgi:DNA-binding transcriptional MerR regulator
MQVRASAWSDSSTALPALVAAAHRLLVAIGAPSGTGGDERVSSFPDARTLRYYQSLGILDRPLRHDGREAVYGHRHLLQAVVTKLLQAEGYSLAQVQRSLLGRTTDALEAAVRASLGGAPLPSATATPPEPPPSDLRALVTREVAPGVLVTLDPRLVHDPDSVLTRITHALTLPPGAPR